MKAITYLLIVANLLCCSCSQYLDIVPDNVATLENAFALRTTAERYLFTCYSYMPVHGSNTGNPAWGAGDETWVPLRVRSNADQIALGNQRIVNPYMNFWEGSLGGKPLYNGIRDCNIFLDNIDVVPDMDETEKRRWIAEVKFLKAYYHYWLFRMYGPIPLYKKDIPISAGVEEVQTFRSSVSECIDYMVELLDEAASDLPARIENEASELGRASGAMARALKAEILVTAASPLFNGNSDYAGMMGKDGKLLFDSDVDNSLWQKAADACKDAIDLCESLGYRLYTYQPQFSQYDLSDTTLIQMSIRNVVCEPWNTELIWGDVINRATTVQQRAIPRGLDPARITNRTTQGNIGVPLKIVEMFYTDKGLPLEDDKTWNYTNRFQLKEGTETDRYNIKQGYTTANMNFNREPRFYASLGFDGGIWYGQGRYDDKASNLFFVSAKKGDPASVIETDKYSVTGYWPKKVVHYQNIIGEGQVYTVQPYPWPVMRLGNLYLLYAEALNEVNGPSEEALQYVNKIRGRAGIPSVEDAWNNYSRNPQKFTTQVGLRDIIHRERLIELAFECQRFWDLRRWKETAKELNNPITGWDIDQADAASYYRERVVYNQQFNTRDYFWPISEAELLKNSNLIQNPGW